MCALHTNRLSQPPIWKLETVLIELDVSQLWRPRNCTQTEIRPSLKGKSSLGPACLSNNSSLLTAEISQGPYMREVPNQGGKPMYMSHHLGRAEVGVSEDAWSQSHI